MEGENFTLIEHFEGIKDPRINRMKLHKLIDIIVIAICAIVAGCDTCDEIEIFGNSHLEWLKKFIELPNGIPSHDTFERVFARLDPLPFKESFLSWTKSIAGVFSDVIAIDGQTHRGARRTDQSKSPIHMVSAWSAGLRLVLAQEKVGEKTNEITAIPEVLKMLDIKGCIITMDAMGCQQKIAKQIVDQGGDYVLGLKGNQGATLTAVEQHFSTVPDEKSEQYSDVDKGHGRIEERKYFAVDAGEILDMKAWPGICSVIKVVSTRQIKDKKSVEERFYLSSLIPKSIKISGDAIRSHWGVENGLHYVLDVTFGQDKIRIRNGNAPENFGIFRHLAMNILRGAPNAKNSSPSINLKRRRAAMDTPYLEDMMRRAGLVVSDI